MLSSLLPPLPALRLWYLFYFAAQYTQLFLPLLLSSVFLYPPHQVGLLIALRRIIICVAAPLFTRLLDHTLLHRPLLLLAHVGYYLCSALLTRVRALRAVAAVLALRELFVSGCEPSVDNATVAKLRQLNRPSADYARLRFYGSVGWGLASVLGSLAVDYLFTSNLLAILYLQLALGVVVVALVAGPMDLSPDLFVAQRVAKAEHSPDPAALPALLTSPHVIFCACAVTMQGVVLGVLQTTTFIYFASLGVSTSALGVSVFLSCVLEAMLFLCTRPLWALLGGAAHALVYGMLLSSVALLLYALVHLSPHVTTCFIIVEALNGATYAMFLTASVAVVSDLAPPHLATSAQGLLAALANGLGPAVGAVLAGLLYDRVGAPALFLALAAFQLVLVTTSVALGVTVDPTKHTPSANTTCPHEGTALL